jgi:hypothetical protein
MNVYLSEQIPAIFTDAAARDLAIPAPILGQPAYLTGIRALTRWRGSAWGIEAIVGGAAATLGAGSTQSIPNNTATQITLATVIEDTHGFALGGSGLTVPAGLGGLYQVMAGLFWASQTTVVGFRDTQIRVGSTAVARAIQSQGTASIAAIQSVSALARLVAGDVVSLWGHHTHGAAINSANDQLYAPRLSIVRVGD